MSTLHLMVGLPCSGKTTLAKRLEQETGALRLTPDDWHRRLFGQDATHPEHDRRHATIESLLWDVAASALDRGLDVILDFGFWQRAERDEFRARAAARGALSVLHVLDPPQDVLFERLAIRNRLPATEATHIPPERLRDWLVYFEPPDDDERRQDATTA